MVSCQSCGMELCRVPVGDDVFALLLESRFVCCDNRACDHYRVMLFAGRVKDDA